MGNLIGSLLNQADALSTHSKGVEIAGRNIANANNPAYARQRMVINDRGSVGNINKYQDLGVEVAEIVQIRDAVLDRQITNEAMQGGSLDARSQYLRTVESIIGEQIDRTFDSANSIQSPEALLAPGGLSSTIDQFFNAFQEVAANPTDQNQKSVLLEKAAILTDRFHQVDNRLSSLDSDINDEIDDSVTEVNGILDQIATLNDQITDVENRTGRTALELRDSRQARLEGLAEMINFETRQDSTSSGHLVVFVRDSSNNEVSLVDGPDKTGDVAYTGTGYTAGSTPTAVTVSEGRLAGLHTVRATHITDLRAELNNLAEGFVTEVNAAYNPLSTVGEDFFDAANTTASNISVVSTITSANLKTSNSSDSGANELALAVGELANQDVTFGTSSFTGTFNEYISKITTDVGSDINTVEIQRENHELVEGMLKQERDSMSGVSVDEEVTDLLRYQRAFQATARVLNTMDGLLEVIVNGLVR